jgi:hypothetical protein
MIYHGALEANGKWASAMFNPGWGEPGEWYMRFSDNTSYTIDNVEGMGNQERYLGFLSADKYRDEVIRNNWKLVGNSDDVVARVLQFVGYDEQDKKTDEQRIERAKAVVLEFAQHAVDSFGSGSSSSDAVKFDSIFKEAEWIASTAAVRIRVYDALKNGETVGMGWSNESFLRDFPDSPYVARIKQMMQETEVPAS